MLGTRKGIGPLFIPIVSVNLIFQRRKQTQRIRHNLEVVDIPGWAVVPYRNAQAKLYKGLGIGKIINLGLHRGWQKSGGTCLSLVLNAYTHAPPPPLMFHNIRRL